MFYAKSAALRKTQISKGAIGRPGRACPLYRHSMGISSDMSSHKRICGQHSRIGSRNACPGFVSFPHRHPLESDGTTLTHRIRSAHTLP